MKSKFERIGDILFEDKVTQDISKKVKQVIKDGLENESLTTVAVKGERIFNRFKNKFKGNV